MWVSSTQETVASGAAFMGLAGIQNRITTDFKQEYIFPGSGHSWLAIPAMLNPGTPIFTDITNTYAPANYDFDNKGTLSINNGVGTYDYVLFRSTYLLINLTKLRLS